MFHCANCWKKRLVRAKQPRQQDPPPGPPAAPVQGKGLGPDQHGGALGSCDRIVLITYREGSQDNCIQGTVIASTAEPSGTN